VDFNDTTVFTAVFAIAFIVLIFKVWNKKAVAQSKIETPPPMTPENSPAMNVTPDVLVPEPPKTITPLPAVQPAPKPIEVVTPPPAEIKQVTPPAGA